MAKELKEWIDKAWLHVTTAVDAQYAEALGESVSDDDQRAEFEFPQCMKKILEILESIREISDDDKLAIHNILKSSDNLGFDYKHFFENPSSLTLRYIREAVRESLNMPEKK